MPDRRRAPAQQALQVLPRSSAETDALHVPAKLYEYLALQRPILVQGGAGGALDRLMEAYGFGLRVS